MAYWITVHYPHPEPDTHPWHVYLQAKFQSIGERFQIGDKVLFYETIHHKPEVGKQHNRKGVEGIAAIATVSGPPATRPADLAVSEYEDGTGANYMWGVPTTDVDKEGYVSRLVVNQVLQHKPGNYFRGYGLDHSGVQSITEEQFNTLAAMFKQGTRLP